MKSGALRKVSNRRRRANRLRAAVRLAVFKRDGYCVLSPFGPLNTAGQDWGPCLGELTYHHLLKAGQGGEYTLANGRTLCEMHNSMIEDWPEAARRAGLVIKWWEGAAVSEKAAYVRKATQSRRHTCHWPGCDRQVPPAMWGCKPHWYALPAELRRRVWRAYRPGQEVDMRPSDAYLVVAREVQDWIRDQANTA